MKQYIQKSILEKELLYFGYEAFGITFVDPVSDSSSIAFSLLIPCHVLKYEVWTCYIAVVHFSGHVDS